MKKSTSRRQVLAAGAAAAVGMSVRSRLAGGAPAGAADVKSPEQAFVYCLNTSTISGQKLDILQELEIAAKVGYTAVEPWVREIQAYQQKGGALSDLKKRIGDLGLSIEGAIGFAEWIVDDDARRAKAMDQLKRELDMLAQIGAKRMAAPAAGATNVRMTNYEQMAERYHAVCELAAPYNIIPLVEVWGPSKTLTTLAEAVHVALTSRHPNAAVLTDVYHMHKGGSDIEGLKLLSAKCIPMIHMNDYPATPARADIKDEHRVFPGEGVAPLPKILRVLRDMGGRCVLSLELFNRQYWKLDATVCARTGIEKVKAAVQQSMQIA